MVEPLDVGGAAASRRAQPPFRFAIGPLDGELVVARGSWERIEVRSERGAVRFAHDRRGRPWLLGNLALIGHRLVCLRDTGIVSTGFEVWDLRTGARVLDVDLPAADGERLHPTTTGRAQAFVSADVGEIWDLETCGVVRRYPHVVGTGCAAVSDHHVAFVDDRSRLRVAVGPEDPGAALETPGEAERLAITGGLLFASFAGAPMRAWDLATRELVHELPACGGGLHVSSDARFVVGERGTHEHPRCLLVDVQTGACTEHDAAICDVDASAHELVLADAERTWRSRSPRPTRRR